MRQFFAVILTAALLATLVILIQGLGPRAPGQRSAETVRNEDIASAKAVTTRIIESSAGGNLPRELSPADRKLPSGATLRLSDVVSRGFKITDFLQERLSAQPFLIAELPDSKRLVTFLDKSAVVMNASALESLEKQNNLRPVQSDPPSSGPEVRLEPKEESSVVKSMGNERTYSDGTTLVARDSMAGPVFVPSTWVQDPKPAPINGEVMSWDAPDRSGYVRVELNRTAGDPYQAYVDNEARLKAKYDGGKLAKYEFRRLREGTEAYLGGVIWNFYYQKNGGKLHRRVIAYFNYKGRSASLLFSIEDDKPKEDWETDIMNSLNEWSRQ